jgi:hypothetical protein
LVLSLMATPSPEGNSGQDCGVYGAKPHAHLLVDDAASAATLWSASASAEEPKKDEDASYHKKENGHGVTVVRCQLQGYHLSKIQLKL